MIILNDVDLGETLIYCLSLRQTSKMPLSLIKTGGLYRMPVQIIIRSNQETQLLLQIRQPQNVTKKNPSK